MLYYLYEMNHAALAPWRAAADAGLSFWKNPSNPLSATQMGRSFAASLEMFERSTRRFGKPAFEIADSIVGDDLVMIEEIEVLRKSFCSVINFRKVWTGTAKPVEQRKLLIVAPMSGHYATLLRGTVEAMLPHYDVYITDWIDARSVPVIEGSFDLDDYIDYVIEILHALGHDTSVMAVCQPSVPVLAAVNGTTRAGGFELMLACDLVLVADEAKVADHHLHFGILPGGGATARLPRLLGPQRAREILLSARFLPGPEVAQVGLALRSVPGEQLLAAALELTGSLVDKPRHTVSRLKTLLAVQDGLSVDEACRLELAHFRSFLDEEPLAGEGYRAFVEKREPAWRTR